MKNQILEQIEVLEEELGQSSGVTLLRLWVEDLLDSGGDPGEAAVHLDEALSTGRLYVPERLSWCQRVGTDRFGVFAEVEVESVSFKMRYIEAGSFLMGSSEKDEEAFPDEKPQHEVKLTEGYWLCDVPCTQALWLTVMGENPSHFEDGPEHPVEQVSWDDCQSFLQKLNEKVRGLDVELPTEAQWEYACRAGSQEARYGELEKVAWYRENSDQQTHPVGQKDPNAWGLYDMLGNVFEWCADGLREHEGGSVTDPVGPQDEGARRVVRGGAWGSLARNVRAARRGGLPRDYRRLALGFRLSRDQKEKKTSK